MSSAEAFVQARDFLFRHREDYETAYREFTWPRLDEFNWPLDYFDPYARGNDHPALWVAGEDGAETKLSFADVSLRSNRAANWLRELGVVRGDRILVMLPNVPQLWELSLAAMKLGAVVCPAHVLLTRDDVQDRVSRGEMRHVVVDASATHSFEGVSGDFTRIVVGGREPGWLSPDEAEGFSSDFEPRGVTRSSDPLLLYFTSGTTAKPKMV
ncbi:MAG: AMP-binding protein, partial [Thermoleophilia bacterium]|nr:AMP-binding protein [Thermoleophilia bacterium]